jgi:hypothetical protein
MGQGIARRILRQILAQLDRTNTLVAGAQMIQGSQEGHAAIGIMLPAVLTVENDADERRLIARNRVADVV